MAYDRLTGQDVGQTWNEALTFFLVRAMAANYRRRADHARVDEDSVAEKFWNDAAADLEKNGMGAP